MAYAGSRLESIENAVKDLWNDTSGNFFSQTGQFVRFVNRAQEEMAQAGLWKKETAINTVASQQSYDLHTLITDIVQPYSARWYDDVEFLEECKSWTHFRTMADSWQDVTGDPLAYYLQSGLMYLVPTPSESVANAIYVYHSYKPAALDVSSAYTPDIPASYDKVYVWKILEMLAMRRQNMELAREYRGLFELEFRKTKSAMSHHNLSVLPG